MLRTPLERTQHQFSVLVHLGLIVPADETFLRSWERPKNSMNRVDLFVILLHNIHFFKKHI